jgi:hypothetical protein
MWFQTIGLTGLITGLGRVLIRYVMRARESTGSWHRPAGPRRPHARGEAGWAAVNSA